MRVWKSVYVETERDAVTLMARLEALKLLGVIPTLDWDQEWEECEDEKICADCGKAFIGLLCNCNKSGDLAG
jgi:hypothetical protein